MHLCRHLLGYEGHTLILQRLTMVPKLILRFLEVVMARCGMALSQNLPFPQNVSCVFLLCSNPGGCFINAEG